MDMAVELGAAIISNDNYRELAQENESKICDFIAYKYMERR